VHGADIAFRDQAAVPVNAADTAHVRVAGIVAFLVMKSLALPNAESRRTPTTSISVWSNTRTDWSRWPGYSRLARDVLVDEALTKLAARFRSDEDDGPRMVADVEEVIGDAAQSGSSRCTLA